MTASDWLSHLSLAISLGMPIAIFAGRNWLKARIEKGVQHRFDVQIEGLRTELRKNEELFKSDLREKETEIATLRDSVLSGSAGRQALLDKRRFEAVEKVWTAVNDLGRLKALSGSMAVVKFDVVARRASEPKMQEFLTILGAAAPSDEEAQKNVALNERPFLPELAWAYFNAYNTILRGNWHRYKILKIGLDDASKYFDEDAIKLLLKAVLPHQEKWIESNQPTLYHYLLDELEGLLLAELRSILEGREADRKATTRAKEIMDAVKQVNEKQIEAAARSDADASIRIGE